MLDTKNTIEIGSTNFVVDAKSVSMMQILTLFIAGYFITSFFNQSNSILASSLIAEFKLSQSQLGVLTGIYFFSFALFQVPLGILLDKFGSYHVQSVLFIIASIGMFLLSSAHSYSILILSRLLIGFGLSSGLMAGFKIIIESVPQPRIAFNISIYMAIGTLGGLFSTLPMHYLLNYCSWREVITFFGVFTLCIAVVIFIKRDRHYHSTDSLLSKQLHDVLRIVKSHEFCRLAPLVSLCFGLNMAILSLWGARWMSTVDHLSERVIAFHLFMATISLIIGILFSGFITSWLKNKFNLNLFQILLGGVFIYITSQCLIPIESISRSPIIWMIFGFSARWLTLGYAIMALRFSNANFGKSLTLLNFSNFMSAFLIPLFIGKSSQFFHMNFEFSDSESLKASMAIIVVLETMAFIWLFMGNSYFINKQEI
jgi:MFS family permease